MNSSRAFRPRRLFAPGCVLFFTVLLQIVMIWILSAVGLGRGEVDREFEEEGLATLISYFQLLILALQASFIFILRYRQTGRLKIVFIWGLAAVGFLLMAQDELFSWHENFDFFVHDYFDIEETALSDRLDDLIVGLYGLIALACLYIYRHELTRFRQVNRLFRIAFVLLFVSVGLDMLTNRPDIINGAFGRNDFSRELRAWLEMFEEGFKLLIEAILISAFYSFFYHSYYPSAEHAQRPP